MKALNKISQIGLKELDSKYAISDCCENPDGIIVRSAAMHDFAFSDKTVAVARAGAGVNNIPLDKCAEQGIVVFNTPGANANGVKELALCALILAARDVVGGIEWVKTLEGTEGVAKAVEAGKSKFAGFEIMGKTLGVIGLGAIGGLVANAAVALGMNVLVYTNEVKEKHQRWNTIFSKDKLYSTCNFVSINIPATPMTRHSVGYDLISQMPEGGCLINTARKEIIDEEGLIRALEERPDLKYATDIAPERYAEMKEKFGDRVFATPKKMGAETAEANINAGLAAAHQIVEYFELGSTRFQVNK